MARAAHGEGVPVGSTDVSKQLLPAKGEFSSFFFSLLHQPSLILDLSPLVFSSRGHDVSICSFRNDDGQVKKEENFSLFLRQSRSPLHMISSS